MGIKAKGEINVGAEKAAQENHSQKSSHEVWKKFNGDKLTGTCYDCRKTIEFDDFQAGHIVPNHKEDKFMLTTFAPFAALAIHHVARRTWTSSNKCCNPNLNR